jgi:sugar lactone lactonase YvrE
MASNGSVGFAQSMAIDSAGNLYVAGGNRHYVFKITPGGAYSRVAGTGISGFSGDGGASTNAQVNNPVDLWIDSSDNIYIADQVNFRIRKITAATGNISTVAGNGTSAITNGAIGFAQGVALDSGGTIYVASGNRHTIRKITTNGVYSTIAGTGISGFSGDGGASTNAQLNNPVDLWIDSSTNIYIADQVNFRIRKIDVSGNISTVAGNGTSSTTNGAVGFAQGVAVDSSGNIYVGGGNTHVLRKITSGGSYSTVAGTGVSGFSGDGGASTNAQLNNPLDVWIDRYDNVFIADQVNFRIREIFGAPAVQNVTSTLANGSYTTGTSISITLTFNRAVTVTGTPRLQLNSGASVFASYGSGSGTTVLTFTNTIASGQTSADLDYLSTSALTLNGGTIVASSDGLSASLTLPTPGATGSLGANKNIVVDTTAPILSLSAPSINTTNGSGSVTYTLTYSGADAVFLADTDITVNSAGSASGIASVSGGGTTSRTVTISSLSGNGALNITVAAGTASDTAGNLAGAQGPSTSFTVDTAAPTISISSPSVSSTLGGTVSYTITYTGADAVGLSDGDITVNATGSASGVAAVSGSGTANRTVTLSSLSGNGTLGISIAANTATDVSGNTAPLAGPSATFNIHPNFAPSFSGGANQIVQTNAGSQSVAGWATGISPGATETDQTVDFILSNDNNALFSAQPVVNAAGDLTFEPAADAFGRATLTIQAHDDGGTANSGTNTSAAQTFTIEVMVMPIRPGDTIVADRGPYVSTGTLLVVNPTDGTQQIITTALKDPYGVALEFSGNILVADYETISIFGTGGLYRLNKYSLARTTVSSGGNFVTPFDLAVEGDGKILVADSDAFSEIGAVFRVNADTGAQTTLATGGNFYWLRGIAVNTNTADIYVSDLVSPTPGSESVIKINSGTGAQSVLSTGGNFSHPDGLALDYSTGDIIVAEAANRMIIRVDKVTGAQTVVSADPQFIQPTHVAVDANGDLWVTDGASSAAVGERRLYKVDKNTGVATIISSDGFFEQPRGIVVAR